MCTVHVYSTFRIIMGLAEKNLIVISFSFLLKKKYLFIWLCQILVMACRLSYPEACGILVSWRGIAPHPLHWKVHSQPLDHQGSPLVVISDQWQHEWFLSLSCFSVLPKLADIRIYTFFIIRGKGHWLLNIYVYNLLFSLNCHLIPIYICMNSGKSIQGPAIWPTSNVSTHILCSPPALPPLCLLSVLWGPLPSSSQGLPSSCNQFCLCFLSSKTLPYCRRGRCLSIHSPLLCPTEALSPVQMGIQEGSGAVVWLWVLVTAVKHHASPQYLKSHFYHLQNGKIMCHNFP